MRALPVITALLLSPAIAGAQQASSSARAQQITAQFTKHKDVVKSKHGVTTAKYKDVRADAVTRQNLRDYAGRYEVNDFGWWIEIEVDANGQLRGTGSDDATFRLEDSRIAAGVLTARKVYGDGRSERFEGVFMNRTERASPTDPGVMAYGLGVLLETPVEAAGGTFDKVFYQLKN